MSFQLDREITRDFERVTGIEWLEPNGLGGWAGTTVAGVHSRRDHGLLVAATRPEQRSVLLSRLDETIHAGGGGSDRAGNRPRGPRPRAAPRPGAGRAPPPRAARPARAGGGASIWAATASRGPWRRAGSNI